jgi:hypothetical protein
MQTYATFYTEIHQLTTVADSDDIAIERLARALYGDGGGDPLVRDTLEDRCETGGAECMRPNNPDDRWMEKLQGHPIIIARALTLETAASAETIVASLVADRLENGRTIVVVDELTGRDVYRESLSVVSARP